MRIFFALFLILMSFFLQSSILEYFQIQGVVPNLLLVVFILIILMAGSREIFWAALTGGLLLDISSPFPFGIFILVFAALGFILGKAKFYLFAKANFIIFLLTVFLATIFYYLFITAVIEAANLFRILVFNFSAKNILFVVLTREILLNLAAAAIIFGLFEMKKTFFPRLTCSNGFRPNF